MELKEGTRLGPYEILAPLGAGGMGEVYQARGKPLDKRTDIFSFGCVLYEGLTGRQAFAGETVSDILASVLKGDPDWLALPSTTPVAIQLLLRRCLQKDPARRLHDIADARVDMDDAFAQPALVGQPTAVTAPVSLMKALPWIVTGLVTVIAGVLLWGPWRSNPPAPQPITRFVIDAQGIGIAQVAANQYLALSPDGSRLVFVADRGKGSQLYLRSMDQLEAKPVPGTEGANGPFFSPDGQWLGFFAGGKLKKISGSGGSPTTLCDASGSRGATWGEDGTIVFTPSFNSGLFRISASGGTPQLLIAPDAKQGETSCRWPDILPGGKAVLFTIGHAGMPSFENGRIAVQDLGTGERKILVEGGSYAHYVPTGHVVFARWPLPCICLR